MYQAAWLVLGVACAVSSIGCASAPIRPPDRRALREADTRVREGCYDCLLEARATYERIGVGNARPLVLSRLFGIDLLLALREKELALDAEPTLNRARTLAADLPSTLGAERYLAVVDAVPYDTLGWPRREQLSFLASRQIRDQYDEHVAFLAEGTLDDEVRHYLFLAFDCAYSPRRLRRSGRGDAMPEAETRAPWPDVTDASPPLLRYRSTICRSIGAADLEAVRSEVPRFVETSLFLARVGYQLQAVTEGRTLAREVYGRFPTSPAVTYLRGTLDQLAGDCRSALAAYAETVALKPGHEDALLGRTVCQSRLGESAEAIGTATGLIEAAAYNYGDAFYWRAWNRHQRKELPQARQDVDSARTLLYNTTVLTLAGIIEYEQADLDMAEQDLVTAVQLDATNCTATWYLGLVGVARERWAEAGTGFGEAVRCYSTSARDSELRRQQMEANTDMDPTFKATQLAGLAAAIQEDRSQESASAFNAAINFFRGGDVESARTYNDLAARDPARADLVADLRKRLDASER